MKEKPQYIASMTGYKATDKDMCCTPNGEKFQFKLGVWYEAEGELELCGNGFHFCPWPSGVWSYYNAEGTRVFKVEAEQVLDLPFEAGADFKRVCRRIRLVEEVIPAGHSSHCNTGDSNTGDRNTGHRNTGDRNTGHSNTGHRNTGHRNTGDSNTGHSNTGHRNTGDSNTGHSNTGDRNTGDRNTGNCNATNYSAGFFCAVEPNVICFDKQTGLKREVFMEKYPEWRALSDALLTDDPIEFEPFKLLPGITKNKLEKLHAKHISGRKAAR
jgi:hypothetical protein